MSGGTFRFQFIPRRKWRSGFVGVCREVVNAVIPVAASTSVKFRGHLYQHLDSSGLLQGSNLGSTDETGLHSQSFVAPRHCNYNSVQQQCFSSQTCFRRMCSVFVAQRVVACFIAPYYSAHLLPLLMCFLCWNALAVEIRHGFQCHLPTETVLELTDHESGPSAHDP
jgi:hypothetical protein